MHRRKLFPLLSVLLLWHDAPAQSLDLTAPEPFRIEAHLEGGPMFSQFRKRGLPEGAALTTMGYNGFVRLMWHPDYMVAIGALAGYEQIVSDRYFVSDSLTDGWIRSSLNAVPMMFDVTIQQFGFEFGLGLGGYIVTSKIEDLTVAHGTRLEFGSIAHLSYRWAISKGLTVGPELFVNYMSYRGILSVSPLVELNYDLISY